MTLRIEFVRSGGFAGLLQRCSLDTETLAPDQAREIERLVASADLPRLAAAPSAPPRSADRFQYDLTVSDGQERLRIRVSEGSVPPQLRPLLDRLLAQLRRR